jgi:hypothetical protein
MLQMRQGDADPQRAAQDAEQMAGAECCQVRHPHQIPYPDQPAGDKRPQGDADHFEQAGNRLGRKTGRQWRTRKVPLRKEGAVHEAISKGALNLAGATNMSTIRMLIEVASHTKTTVSPPRRSRRRTASAMKIVRMTVWLIGMKRNCPIIADNAVVRKAKKAAIK